MDEAERYPTARLDALSDGIFAVAMTLLVLDVRLPDDFHPKDGQDLLDGLFGLGPKLLPYVLSFLVLGLRWLAGLETRGRTESVGRRYAMWTLLYLLLVTAVPLTSIVVGRFASMAPAIWLYAGNTLIMAILAWMVLRNTPQFAHDELLLGRRISLAILAFSSLLAIAWSFIGPRDALWALALNAFAPLATRWVKARQRQVPAT